MAIVVYANSVWIRSADLAFTRRDGTFGSSDTIRAGFTTLDNLAIQIPNSIATATVISFANSGWVGGTGSYRCKVARVIKTFDNLSGANTRINTTSVGTTLIVLHARSSCRIGTSKSALILRCVSTWGWYSWARAPCCR